MSKVIKITKPTFNALTDTDQRHFNLDSDFEAVIRLQDVITGTASLGAGPLASVTVDEPHGLSYIPFFQVFLRWHNITQGTDSNWIPSTLSYGTPIGFLTNYQPKVDATNISMIWKKTGSTDAYDIDYVIYVGRDPIA